MSLTLEDLERLANASSRLIVATWKLNDWLAESGLAARMPDEIRKRHEDALAHAVYAFRVVRTQGTTRAMSTPEQDPQQEPDEPLAEPPAPDDDEQTNDDEQDEQGLETEQRSR